MKTRVIKDIRLFESDQPNELGCPLPRNLGTLMNSSPLFLNVALRIARKLNELQFCMGEADHLYLNFSSCLEPNVIRASTRRSEKWLQYVDIGMDFVDFNKKTVEVQELFIVDVIFNVLELFADSTSQREVLVACRAALEVYGKEMKISLKSKETTAYIVWISYQIAPDDVKSVLSIDYLNKKSGDVQSFSSPLRFYEDAYVLVDKVHISNGTLSISPKKSFRADLYASYYQTPLCFSLNKVL